MLAHVIWTRRTSGVDDNPREKGSRLAESVRGVWPVRKSGKFTLADRAKTDIASLRCGTLWHKARRNAMGIPGTERARVSGQDGSLPHRLADFRQRSQSSHLKHVFPTRHVTLETEQDSRSPLQGARYRNRRFQSRAGDYIAELATRAKSKTRKKLCRTGFLDPERYMSAAPFEPTGKLRHRKPPDCYRPRYCRSGAMAAFLKADGRPFRRKASRLHR